MFNDQCILEVFRINESKEHPRFFFKRIDARHVTRLKLGKRALNAALKVKEFPSALSHFTVGELKQVIAHIERFPYEHQHVLRFPHGKYRFHLIQPEEVPPETP